MSDDASVLARGNALLASLGTFWASYYPTTAVPAAAVGAYCQVVSEAHTRLQTAIATLSRDTVPVFAYSNWLPIVLNNKKTAGGDYVTTVPNFAGACCIADRLLSPELWLVPGIDFDVGATGTIQFAQDPFANEMLPRRVLADGSEEIVLWACDARHDVNLIYTHWGYVLGAYSPASAEYAQLVDAALSAITNAPTSKQLRLFLSLVFGIACAGKHETVETITVDNNHQVVVTDKSVYLLHKNATLTVAPGVALLPGDPLCSDLQFYRPGLGQRPDLPAWAVDSCMLSVCRGAVLFPNREVPLEVDHDADGFARVRFGLGGDKRDVAAFFDELHQKGRAAAVAETCGDTDVVTVLPTSCEDETRTYRRATLAHLLDRRRVLTSEPTADTLPKTINPYKFLFDNVLRNNAVIVTVQLNVSVKAMGVRYLRLLSHFTPPQQLVIVALLLTPPPESVNMAESVNDTAAVSLGLSQLGSVVDVPASVAARARISAIQC